MESPLPCPFQAAGDGFQMREAKIERGCAVGEKDKEPPMEAPDIAKRTNLTPPIRGPPARASR
jgi:hypothetical protein